MDQKRLTSNYPLVRCWMFDFSKNYVGPTLTYLTSGPNEYKPQQQLEQHRKDSDGTTTGR